MSRFPSILLALVITATSLAGERAAWAQQRSDSVAPEAASTAAAPRAAVAASTQMVVAANPLAAEAGLAVLRDGGNAIDAMVTVQLVLGLVEPQSSGLGGGSFLVYFDAAANRLTTFDGRETAPRAATPQLFLDAGGKPLAFFDAVVGGRSVGTPGTVKLLYETQARHGRLAWRRLIEPAVTLAEAGFTVSPRLASLIAEEGDRLKTDPDVSAYFFDAAGAPLRAGMRLTNPAYAQTLRTIAAEGAAGFYTGRIAADIVAEVAGHTANPGKLSLEDLASYRIVEREPVCAPYRGLDVCGMGPPSSGALTVGQILGLIEPYDIAALGPTSAKAWRLIGDASRLAFADRGRYMADIDFVPMPLKGLLDTAYLADRAKLLSSDRALPSETATAGEPPWDHAELRGDGAPIELPSTSHFVIVDRDRNVVSMTTTIENGFGSRLMVDGFLLNNELTDFSFETQEGGRPIANRVEPGKRPRSSMAPTIVMKDGKPFIAIGSPGGSQIIGYVAQAIIALVDWKMDVQAAVAMPHLLNRFGPFEVEKGTSAEQLTPQLQALGFTVKPVDLNSGLHAVVLAPDGLRGGADPRREGVAVGD